MRLNHHLYSPLPLVSEIEARTMVIDANVTTIDNVNFMLGPQSNAKVVLRHRPLVNFSSLYILMFLKKVPN